MGIRVMARPGGRKSPESLLNKKQKTQKMQKTKAKAAANKTKTKGNLPVGFKHGGKVKRKK